MDQLISVFVCVCVVIPFILDVRLMDAPAGVTREEVTFVVLTLFLTARSIQPFLSLVDRKVSNFVYPRRIDRSPLVGHDARKKSQFV